MKDDTNGAVSVTEEYHDDFPNTEGNDMQAFWRKETEPRFKIPSPVGPSKWRTCVVFSLIAVVLLALIVAIAMTNGQSAGRFSALQESLANINSSFHAIIHSIKLKDANKQQKINQLEFSIHNMQKEVDKVADSAKPLPALESQLSELRCSFKKVMQNDTSTGCCPLGWLAFGSNCYFFSSTGLSWHNARTTCVTHGAMLLVLKSAEEKRFVLSHTMPLFFWLGLTDEEFNGHWKWVDGTPYTVIRSDWKPNQPDDWHLHGLGGGEDCAHFHADGRYNDDHCTRVNRYVCKAPISAALKPIFD
ncbi:asialoglycoprotein receptor 1 [Engraulis encrasicolus]|uniref:asialoglycoprotein receptor 1 n=1 Tax=Engraulis encrasicolus TaxID=184585 RepID=UPI002FCF77B8